MPERTAFGTPGTGPVESSTLICMPIALLGRCLFMLALISFMSLSICFVFGETLRLSEGRRFAGSLVLDDDNERPFELVDGLRDVRAFASRDFIS